MSPPRSPPLPPRSRPGTCPHLASCGAGKRGAGMERSVHGLVMSRPTRGPALGSRQQQACAALPPAGQVAATGSGTAKEQPRHGHEDIHKGRQHGPPVVPQCAALRGERSLFLCGDNRQLAPQQPPQQADTRLPASSASPGLPHQELQQQAQEEGGRQSAEPAGSQLGRGTQCCADKQVDNYLPLPSVCHINTKPLTGACPGWPCCTARRSETRRETLAAA